MERIKEPSVANSFYSGNTNTLRTQIENFKKNNVNPYEYKSKAVIVPHAGLIYSGQLAYKGINQLDRNIKNIIIFAPAHRMFFNGISLTGFDKWRTPLGDIEINQEINNEIIKKFNGSIFDDAYKEEHSVEIQVPIIQSIFNEVKIIPVLIGRESPNKITEIIEYYYKNPDFGFIISSDLSHFLKDEDAKNIDLKTANMIETGNINGFTHEQACGAVGIFGLCNFANKNNFSLIRVDMYNSSLVSNDKERVVGYGSWLLFEGEKNEFIKKYYSNYIVNLCKKAISSNFNKEKFYTDHSSVFDEFGACFVTLKKNDKLRGCIGSIIAHRPLIVDLVHHAADAAFNDYRFPPLQEDELDNLKISISLLSEPKPIAFKDEEDLLNKIVPYQDGIIIKDKNYQAVYLPSVWEELPNKKAFLNSLKVKAGLPYDYFSNTFEAYRFETKYIEE